MTEQTQKPEKTKIKFSTSVIGINDFGETIYSIYFGGISITFDSVSFDKSIKEEDQLIFFHRKTADHHFGLTCGAIPKRWFDQDELAELMKCRQEVE